MGTAVVALSLPTWFGDLSTHWQVDFDAKGKTRKGIRIILASNTLAFLSFNGEAVDVRWSFRKHFIG